MYFDLENGPEIEEDFLTALNLLHSTDEDSAESLRRMLDALIAEKVGPTKTLAARRMGMDSHLYEKGQGINPPSQNVLAITQYPKIEELAEKSTPARAALKAHAPPTTAVITTRIGQKMANVLVAVDKTEIPTISIPDEGSSAGDGALCKICNGPRLGPFILLECQECQDVYHPLCHQPPVLDLDIYDPRLVWHCAKCVELSEAAAVVAAAEIEDKKIDRKYSAISIHETDPSTKDERIGNDPKDQLNFFRRNESRLIPSHHQDTSTSDQFQLRNRTSVGRRATKRQTKSVEQVSVDRNGSIKNDLQTLAFSSTPSSGLHLRKRVGSKLTMTRSGTAGK